MSENLDLVRSIYADWERGNFTNANWADPEIEFELADGPEPGSVTGVAEMARSWSHRLGVWEGFHTVPDDYREVDDERVLALYRFSGRGKGSGIDLGPMAWRVPASSTSATATSPVSSSTSIAPARSPT